MIKFNVNKSNVNNIPSNVTHLIFEKEFNQHIEIPNSVTHLLIGDYFNQPIVIPNSVTYLSFGYNFNQIVDIPTSVIHLIIGNEFDIIDNNIPNNIIHLTYHIDYPIYRKNVKLHDNLIVNKFIVEKVNHLIINLDFQLMIDSEYIITNEMISKIYKNLVISIIDFFDDSIDDSIDNNIKYNNEIIQNNENFYIKYKNMLPYFFKKFIFLKNPNNITNNDYLYDNDELINYIIYNYYENLCKLRNRLVPIHSELITKVLNPNRLQKIANTYNIELVDLMDYY